MLSTSNVMAMAKMPSLNDSTLVDSFSSCMRTTGFYPLLSLPKYVRQLITWELAFNVLTMTDCNGQYIVLHFFQQIITQMIYLVVFLLAFLATGAGVAVFSALSLLSFAILPPPAAAKSSVIIGTA